MITMQFAFLARVPQKWYVLTESYRGFIMSICLIISNINLDHLINAGLGIFLYKVIVFFVTVNEHWGRYFEPVRPVSAHTFHPSFLSSISGAAL